MNEEFKVLNIWENHFDDKKVVIAELSKIELVEMGSLGDRTFYSRNFSGIGQKYVLDYYCSIAKEIIEKAKCDESVTIDIMQFRQKLVDWEGKSEYQMFQIRLFKNKVDADETSIKIEDKKEDTEASIIQHNKSIGAKLFANLFKRKVDYNKTDQGTTLSINANLTTVDNSILSCNKGDEKFNAKKYREAIIDYSDAINIDSNCVLAYYKRGRSKFVIKDYRGAIEDFSKIISINPNDHDVYFQRARAKTRIKDYNGAIVDYSEAIMIDPNYKMAYCNRAIIKKDYLRDYKGAKEDLTSLISIDPENFEAYNLRGLTNAKLNDINGALEDHSKAIECNPEFAAAYHNRGVLKDVHLDDFDGAIKDFTIALNIDPQRAIVYICRGNAYYGNFDFFLAIKDYNAAIEIKPDFAKAYENRGLAFWHLLENERAMQDFKISISIDPKRFESYSYMNY